MPPPAGAWRRFAKSSRRDWLAASVVIVSDHPADDHGARRAGARARAPGACRFFGPRAKNSGGKQTIVICDELQVALHGGGGKCPASRCRGRTRPSIRGVPAWFWPLLGSVGQQTRLSGNRCSVRPVSSLPRNARNDLFQRELRCLPNLGDLLQAHCRSRFLDAKKIVGKQLIAELSQVITEHFASESVALPPFRVSLSPFKRKAFARLVEHPPTTVV
jgi:hypothetical protein